ncbi:MAG TPA: alpha/beta hydrolase [Candidatus Binataceae bacterium]|nr:alpha/beta hydrolase [Candidatus Binataceae bacterium]
MTSESAAIAAAEPTNCFFELDGLKLHYLDWGGDATQRTFMLLHGGGAHAHWWDFVAPELSNYGHVVALDFRGHGRSEWSSNAEYGPPSYIRDVSALIDFLGTKVVLVGHSMGGAVAQWCAVTFPEKLAALIVVDSPAGPPPLLRRLQWRWRRRAQGGKRPELRAAEDIIRKFRLSPPGTYLTKEQLEQLAMKGALQLPNGHWAFRFDPETRAWRKHRGRMTRPNLRQVKLPTLILRGAESTLVAPRHARRMNRKVAGSILKVIPRAFHHVPLDNPAATSAAIIEFVESKKIGAA